MDRENYFWTAMQHLASSTVNQRPITTDELNIIYDMLEDLHGFWEAGNFVKLCAHLKHHTVQEVTKAAIDLKSNHFFYETTIANEKKRITIAPSPRRSGWFYGDFDYHAGRRSENTARYPEHRINQGPPAMAQFISQHFIHLTDTQKQCMPDLRGWGKKDRTPRIQ